VQRFDRCTYLHYNCEIMAKRKLPPEAREIAYTEFFRNGLCPNSGNPCEQIARLGVQYQAALDSIRVAGPVGLPLNEATTARFYETSAAIQGDFEEVIADDQACLGSCALAETAEPQQQQ